MLEITFNKHTYPIPERWEELTPDLFINLVELLRAYNREELTVDQVRTMFFLEAAGIQPQRIRLKEQADMFSENVFRISSQLNFMFRVEYENKKAIAAFPAGIQTILSRFLPEELEDDSVEIRAARKLRKERVIDSLFGKNLIPDIPIRRKVLKGYRFDIIGSIIQCDLKAGQFIDACTIYDQFSESGDPVYLDMITAILYGGEPHELLKQVPDKTKAAVLFNFQSILLFLQEKTDYSVIWWNQPVKSKKKSSSRLGFSDSLYTIVKAGYGDLQNLKDLPVIDFLNLLVKELRDAVLTLKEAKKNNAEIAEATKLSLAQVNFLLR